MDRVSVLYREPKLLKEVALLHVVYFSLIVSVLYREPKLLKGNRFFGVNHSR